ncbi:MAG: cation transporter [Nitrospirae bacterium]|nr:cation transporter [Nitrospirota bacterium]
MKAISTALVLFVIAFVAANPLFAGETKSVTLKVEGMTCTLCPKMVKKALSGIEGVKAVQVSFEKKEAFVEYDEGKTNVQEMIKVVDGAGYKASVSTGGKAR